jgi:hypothetical protein
MIPNFGNMLFSFFRSPSRDFQELFSSFFFFFAFFIVIFFTLSSFVCLSFPTNEDRLMSDEKIAVSEE